MAKSLQSSSRRMYQRVVCRLLSSGTCLAPFIPTAPAPAPRYPMTKSRRTLCASLQRNDLWHVDLFGADCIAPDHLSVSVSIRYTIECSNIIPHVE